MLLALFLIDLAAGMYCFLPFVGRRNAGPKFYRLVIIVSASPVSYTHLTLPTICSV